jgi:hypothetical protein
MSEKKIEKILEMKSEMIPTIIVVENVITKRVYNPNTGKFEIGLFHIKVEFNPVEWCIKNPCMVCGSDASKHSFQVARGLIIETCMPQAVTQASIPIVERGETLPWCKLVSEERLTFNGAKQLLKKLDLVPSPDVTLLLLRGK